MVAPSEPPEDVGKNVYGESTVYVRSTFPLKVIGFAIDACENLTVLCLFTPCA